MFLRDAIISLKESCLYDLKLSSDDEGLVGPASELVYDVSEWEQISSAGTNEKYFPRLWMMIKTLAHYG